MFRTLRPVIALFAAALAYSTARADDADLSGGKLLRYSTPETDVNVCILKLESKDRATTATVLAVPPKTRT